MSRSFYLGAAVRELETAASAIRLLEQEGFKCTYDWTRYLAEGRVILEAIQSADFTLFLSPGGHYSLVGVGISLGLGKPTYLINLGEEPTLTFPLSELCQHVTLIEAMRIESRANLALESFLTLGR